MIDISASKPVRPWRTAAGCHIRLMRIFRALGVLVSLVGFADPVLADQTDPRLGPLFEQLRTASEPAAAVSIEEQIWAIWLETADQAVDALMENGIDAMNRGDYRAALEVFDQVVTLAPDFAEGWNKRATVHYILNNLDRSLADIVATLNLEPRHFGALSGRGLVFVKLRDLERALSAFEEALEVSPQMPGARANVEAIRQVLGQRKI
ncbi:MAG: tetratricopeptide repeat protein [Bauldia sp.]